MTFLPAGIGQVEQSDIVLIGDCLEATNAPGNPLSAAADGALQQAIHMGNMRKSDLKIVNLFPETKHLEKFWLDNTKAHKRVFTGLGQERVAHFLEAILPGYKPKVVVPMGPCATQALLKRTDYTAIRGYPFQQDNWLVIPTLHPKDMVWSNYIWRFYLSHDLTKARGFVDGTWTIFEPELIIPKTFAEAREILKFVLQHKLVSYDIEVSNYEVSCIGFSVSNTTGYSIPFDERWSVEEETTLWRLVALILGDTGIRKIGQNVIFDSHFLAYRMGIFVRGIINDVMVAHSLAWPEFLKGLGFLGGIHLTTTYWKDQGGYKSIKEND